MHVRFKIIVECTHFIFGIKVYPHQSGLDISWPEWKQLQLPSIAWLCKYDTMFLLLHSECTSACMPVFFPFKDKTKIIHGDVDYTAGHYNRWKISPSVKKLANTFLLDSYKRMLTGKKISLLCSARARASDGTLWLWNNPYTLKWFVHSVWSSLVLQIIIVEFLTYTTCTSIIHCYTCVPHLLCFANFTPSHQRLLPPAIIPFPSVYIIGCVLPDNCQN